ncbi:hypothetical protein NA57DRAFT_60004 [Rhizodiscina lignyota]|uniref:F-box domain-containing protein n=1 Tax=Rhizodiscina lignyota TaxID=1504668 RepID=A0A9P4IAA1_9PEZI|nr:hypothetical protein NA57DRAFT_60004 [Rhizodiscina lignyota]
MASNGSTSRPTSSKKHFFDLPVEIRLIIYEYVFGPSCRLASIDPYHIHRSQRVSIQSPLPPKASITRVCRTIRREAVAIFNQSHIFCHNSKHPYPALSAYRHEETQAWRRWKKLAEKLQIVHVRDFQLGMEISRMPESAERPRQSKQENMSTLTIYVSMDPHKCHVRCKERDSWRTVKLSPTSWELIDSVIRETLGSSNDSTWNGLTVVEMVDRIKEEQRRLLCLEIPKRCVRHDLIAQYSRSETKGIEMCVLHDGFQRL